MIDHDGFGRGEPPEYHGPILVAEVVLNPQLLAN